MKFFRKLFRKKPKYYNISVRMELKPILGGKITFEKELDATLKALRFYCLKQYEDFEKTGEWK